jgi:hypothetical protein
VISWIGCSTLAVKAIYEFTQNDTKMNSLPDSRTSGIDFDVATRKTWDAQPLTFKGKTNNRQCMKSRVFTLIAGHLRWGFVCPFLVFCPIPGLTQSDLAATQCPRVTVSCPSTNQPVYDFTATVIGSDPTQRFAYHWRISTGKLISGQGTPAIKVTGEPPLTATVELTGLPSECTQTRASCSILGGHHMPPVQLIDEFGYISFQRVKPHLDELAFHLRNSPGSMGSIVSTRKWTLAKKAIGYLSSKHNLPAERILIVDQKKKGPLLVKLYIVPPGAVLPG